MKFELRSGEFIMSCWTGSFTNFNVRVVTMIQGQRAGSSTLKLLSCAYKNGCIWVKHLHHTKFTWL